MHFILEHDSALQADWRTFKLCYKIIGTE